MKLKVLQIDAELYDYIARHTEHIGESASAILRRLLKFSPVAEPITQATTIPIQTMTLAVDLRPQQAIARLLKSTPYQREITAIGRFMRLLSALYQSEPPAFSRAAANTQGRTRRYFARDPETLLRHGLPSKPQNIPQTPYWVITNTNAARKRAIIQQLLVTMEFPTSLIEAVCDTL